MLDWIFYCKENYATLLLFCGKVIYYKETMTFIKFYLLKFVSSALIWKNTVKWLQHFTDMFKEIFFLIINKDFIKTNYILHTLQRGRKSPTQRKAKVTFVT